ncbi:MAG: hypothetical protein MUC33_24555 [Desulfobacterales bacterium]|nr:hypothetical protein [Desulfobacterales bacterium]
MRLDIDALADMTWVAVSDPVPAGATILGTGLGRDSRLLAADDDRREAVRPAFEERSFEGFRAYFERAPKGTWTVEYTLRHRRCMGKYLMQNLRFFLELIVI